MTKINFIQTTGEIQTASIDENTSVMRAAIDSGVPGIIGECGGQAMCATCHVYVVDPQVQLPEISEDENEMLDCTAEERTDRSRLSCQLLRLSVDQLDVEVPARQL